jgi:hypothetical protein
MSRGAHLYILAIAQRAHVRSAPEVEYRCAVLASVARPSGTACLGLRSRWRLGLLRAGKHQNIPKRTVNHLKRIVKP